MIIYVLIFSMIFSLVLVLFSRVQSAGIKAQIAAELRANGEQIFQQLEHRIREAGGVDLGNSVFNNDVGALILLGDDRYVFDTHQKLLSVGGINQTIRKIKFRKNSLPSVDLSSDYVNVNAFRIRNLSSPSEPASFQIELTLSNVNPGGTPDYDDQITLRSAVSFRKEL